MAPATFLNLDLELLSKIDLAPLAAYLDEHASLLHSADYFGDFHITAEAHIGGHETITVEDCTREMLRTLATLPVALRELLDGCHLRVFDYGFDGGLQSAPLSVDLPADQLAAMSSMGIGIRVTVYPHHPEAPAQGEAKADA